MITVTFILKGGSRQTLDATAGDTIMQLATGNSVPGIEGACGGFCSCATCHVYVESGHLLPPPAEDEDAMLAGAAAPREANSRLGCQITLTPELDGLVVRIPERQ